MQDMSGNPDVERRAETFKEEWVNEAVMRYFHNKLQQRRAELEQAINQKPWRNHPPSHNFPYYWLPEKTPTKNMD